MEWLQNRFQCCESCCINKRAKCGQRIKTFNGLIVYAQSCHQHYERQFSQDLIFLCSLSLVISFGLFINTIALVVSFNIIRKNYKILLRSGLF